MPADMNSRYGAVGAIVEQTRKKILYVTSNARLDPEWASADRRTVDRRPRCKLSHHHARLSDLYRI
jgi:hypothetical protein